MTQIKPCILLVALTLGFVTTSLAQPKNYEIRNGFAIGGGITQFDIQTDNFITNAGSGWLVSAGIGAVLPHRWYDISYNMQISENNLDISGRVSDDVNGNETIEYKMFAVQAGIIWHINIIGSFLTLDLGPQLQYNGDLEIKNDGQRDYFLNGFDMLQAKDIEDINNFNINAMGGATAGIGPFKVRAQYIYGILNSFNKLNDDNLNVPESTDFKGNQSFWMFSASFTF